jgi:DNA topoisomerase-1
MSVAQQLYEGLEVGGEGSVGLITYIRTDSVRVSTEAQEETRGIIAARFGQEFIPPTPPVYKTKAVAAQDAHEAIRPTTIRYRPEEIKSYLSRDQFRLYQLIWNRFVASQMSPAVLDSVSVEIEGGDFLFRATGSQIKFAGFLVLYTEDTDEENVEEEGILPEVTEGIQTEVIQVDSQQRFTQPPPRYSEAMLVKALEEKGIGRPSTYAPTIDTILKRHYVVMEEKRFHPTELGKVVVDLLKENFRQIVDPDFTAEMEEKFDQIEEGKEDWVEVIRAFYLPFADDLEKAEETIERVNLEDEVSDVECERCGRKMVYKYGRYGRFLACPGYPECKNIKSIKKELGVDCPQCGGKVVERRSKKGRRFYGCDNYPTCTFTSWYPPAKVTCPQCGSFCVVKSTKRQGEMIICSQKECGYKKSKDTPEEKGAQA